LPKKDKENDATSYAMLVGSTSSLHSSKQSQANLFPIEKLEAIENAKTTLQSYIVATWSEPTVEEEPCLDLQGVWQWDQGEVQQKTHCSIND
jgi:hypothetical protein